MRIGYADPPYPGQAKKHYGDHPDYGGEVDHVDLIHRLDTQYDGFVLHTSSVALGQIMTIVHEYDVECRVMAWVKPFAAFKRNVPVAYAWEPVLVKPCRKPVVSGRMVMRDFLAEGITMKRGLSGAKPERVCHWLFECVGAHPDDALDDMFPGSGAVSRAWESWRQQIWGADEPCAYCCGCEVPDGANAMEWDGCKHNRPPHAECLDAVAAYVATRDI